MTRTFENLVLHFASIGEHRSFSVRVSIVGGEREGREKGERRRKRERKGKKRRKRIGRGSIFITIRVIVIVVIVWPFLDLKRVANYEREAEASENNCRREIQQVSTG